MQHNQHETLDDPQRWLGPTALLDLDDPKLRIRVLRITQLAQSPTQKAVLIHNFIKSLPFGCVPVTDNTRAGTVLRTGKGDCHTKGTLFVAMLRIIGIPSRLRFVSLSSEFMSGIISLPGIAITHAMTEIFLSEKWHQVDTYVTDEAFEARALELLKKTGETLGFGIHAKAQRNWSGTGSAYGQYTPTDTASLPDQDLGTAHDPEYFYQNKDNAKINDGWLSRFKWLLASKVINYRVNAIRTGPD